MTVYHPQPDDRMVMRKQRFMECVIINAARVLRRPQTGRMVGAPSTYAPVCSARCLRLPTPGYYDCVEIVAVAAESGLYVSGENNQ